MRFISNLLMGVCYCVVVDRKATASATVAYSRYLFAFDGGKTQSPLMRWTDYLPVYT